MIFISSHKLFSLLLYLSFCIDVFGHAEKWFNFNKKSHELEVSANKLLGDQSGNIKMLNEFFGQDLEISEHHHRKSIFEFCISKSV